MNMALFFFISCVVVFQIWKTEYTRVQLPGHEKPSMSQGHVLSSAPEEAGNTNTLHFKSKLSINICVWSVVASGHDSYNHKLP